MNRTAARAIISHPRRCYLLSELEPDEPATVAELVRVIADRDPSVAAETVETTEDVDVNLDLDESVRQQLTIELVHNHLPRLDDRDVPEYDRTEDEVIRTTAIDGEQPEAVIDPPVDSVGGDDSIAWTDD